MYPKLAQMVQINDLFVYLKGLDYFDTPDYQFVKSLVEQISADSSPTEKKRDIKATLKFD